MFVWKCERKVHCMRVLRVLKSRPNDGHKALLFQTEMLFGASDRLNAAEGFEKLTVS